jgi:hypothetical protein
MFLFFTPVIPIEKCTTHTHMHTYPFVTDSQIGERKDECQAKPTQKSEVISHPQSTFSTITMLSD